MEEVPARSARAVRDFLMPEPEPEAAPANP
jgi:hypothetical protein